MPVLFSPPQPKSTLPISRFPVPTPSVLDLAGTVDSEQEIYLGWILVRHCWITSAQLEKALDIQQANGCRLGELLVQQAHLTPEQLEMALKELFWRRNGYWII